MGRTRTGRKIRQDKPTSIKSGLDFNSRNGQRLEIRLQKLQNRRRNAYERRERLRLPGTNMLCRENERPSSQAKQFFKVVDRFFEVALGLLQLNLPKDRRFL
jgi:hypothetical protein